MVGSTARSIRVIPLFAVNGRSLAIHNGSKLRYTHTDHPSTGSGHRLGSSSGQTDTAGNATADSYLCYYAYGGLRSGVPSAATTDRTFTGQKSDGTGLMYYNARYYDPALGTFLSPDTLVPDAGNPQSFNRYSYVYNNPLKYVDPSGHIGTGVNGNCMCGGVRYEGSDGFYVVSYLPNR